MISVQLFRVFTDSHGNFGDKASVIIDEGRKISEAKRQDIAQELDTGETIFINNVEKAEISVIHPQGEIDFAGVGVLAAAYFLRKLRKKPLEKLVGRNGEIQVWQEDNYVWVRSNIDQLPKWNIKQLENDSEVENVKLQETTRWDHTIIWAFIDETKGLIRARTFAKDWDIPEAEGNGSGAMLLAHKLQRNIEIIHGKGSVIFANPAPDNFVDLGGRVMAEAKADCKK